MDGRVFFFFSKNVPLLTKLAVLHATELAKLLGPPEEKKTSLVSMAAQFLLIMLDLSWY